MIGWEVPGSASAEPGLFSETVERGGSSGWIEPGAANSVVVGSNPTRPILQSLAVLPTVLTAR